MTACWALGLMSGTSLDGIDLALIKTDGHQVFEYGPANTVPYAPDFREKLRSVLGQEKPSARRDEIAHGLTSQHANAIKAFLSDHNRDLSEISVVGFHGQTLFHDPDRAVTVQIGNGGQLASETGCRVVNDFRSADVRAGGQGAPFAPVYHRALVRGRTGPLVVLNIGGVSNVTWIDPTSGQMVAFDTGPGNAMMDDWVKQHTGQAFDADGAGARNGIPDEQTLDHLLGHSYFAKPAPKSLDRDDFASHLDNHMQGVTDENRLATLAAFTVRSIAMAQKHFPDAAREWIVVGGGRRNGFLMESLERQIGSPVIPAEDLGWDGDAIEAQAFAFMAVRKLKDLPISFPGTTGVSTPMTGGVIHNP